MRMVFLIDTHILLWYLAGSKNLSPAIRTEIDNPKNDIFISVASFWELAIKISLGKMNAEVSLSQIEQDINSREFRTLNISLSHLHALATLPPVHGDPFDRMIIAQAMVEKLTILSADRHFKDYPVSVLW